MTEQPMHTRLGLRLRELRLARNLSVRTLAARSGFSPSFISNVESETVSPSIASLEKIATALGVTLSQLFSSIESTPRIIIRRPERATYRSEWSNSIAAVLTDSGSGRLLSAVEVAIAPGGASGSRVAPIAQELFSLVLDGVIELTLNTDAIMLERGDSVYLNRGSRVVWRNNSAEQATLLFVSVTDRVGGIADLFVDTDTSTDTPDLS